jgi:phosphoribosylanthranilate isomerase
MTWVKICGITNLEDALTAVDAGADAIGFVFYEKSPRCVSVDTVREIVKKLPKGVEKVGVFVGATSDAVADISRLSGLTAVQIYTNSRGHPPALDDEFVKALPCRVIAAISTELVAENELAGFHISRQTQDRILAILLDSGRPERPGGTGRTFDWEMASPINELISVSGLRLIVAGGLTADNVSQAMHTLRPWGVDVVSGVEAKPGKKDPNKVRAFVRAVRETDRDEMYRNAMGRKKSS